MIAVWLKIRDRGNTDFVLKHLNFWLGLFSNRNKYEIFIYNENFNLTNLYKNTIITRQKLQSNIDCVNMDKVIHSNMSVVQHWKKTAFALAAPYFYLKDYKYVWNIDSDDMALYGPNIYNYIEQVESLIELENLPTLSHDWLFSSNCADPKIPHHWTFGVNLSNIEMMSEIIPKAIQQNYPHPFKLGNLDYVVDCYLNKQLYKYLCFISPSQLVDNLWYCRYNEVTNLVEAGLLNNTKKFAVKPHPKTKILKV